MCLVILVSVLKISRNIVCKDEIVDYQCRSRHSQIDGWEDPSDPFNATATGYLGRKRKSMLSNPILLRHQVGKPFQSRMLPCDDFIYGSLPAPSLSAAHALRGWAGYIIEPTSWATRKKPNKATNFLALNRAAVTGGITNEKELRDFRNTHRIKFELSEQKGLLYRPPPPTRLDPLAEFGKPTEYITTAGEIMSEQEKREWMRCVKACNDQKYGLTKKLNGWRENHASTLRMYSNKTGLKPDTLWHMPKFEKKAKPHLSTFRNEKAYLAAHNANNYERVGRDGMFGQGISTKAINKNDLIRCKKA